MTASSVEDGKHTRALAVWAVALHSKFSVVPQFVHTDKDMAEIGTSHRVWPNVKHQLCWWHQHEALRRRLKGNLPTSPYNAQQAADEYAFIKVTFKPYGCIDPNDSKGSILGEVHEQDAQGKNAETTPLTSKDPNSIKIWIPIAHVVHSNQSISEHTGQHQWAATCQQSPQCAESLETFHHGHKKWHWDTKICWWSTRQFAWSSHTFGR